MVSFEGSGQCQEAQFYYHDFLEDRGIVPRPVADHIDGCAYCRAHVQQLARVLAGVSAAGNPHRLNHSRELMAELQSHFEHVGRHVTCSQVKRFLPGLLADRIRIPTPITVHVDQCDPCMEDLTRLGSLGLTEEQLARLEELYAEPIRVDLSLCRQVKLMLADTDDLRLEEVPAHIADHIRLCPQCRRRVYEARQDLLYHYRERPVADPYVGCGRIVSADIFDFVVLHNDDAAGQALTSDWHRTVAEHVFSCSRCLAKVQNMHEIIFGVAERADSGVATVYTPTEAATASSKTSRSIYAAYPIDVRVIGGRLKTPRRRSRRAGILVTALKRRLRGRKLKSLVPATALATIVVLLMGLYVVSSQSASGLNLDRISHAAARKASVRILTFHGDSPEPTSETWISGSVDVIAYKVRGQAMRVDDTRNRSRILVSPDGLQMSQAHLTTSQYDDDRGALQNKLGSEFAGFSVNAELEHQDSPSDGPYANLDMYEIITPATGQGEGSVENRLRVYLDPIKKLLRITEFSRRFMPDGPWETEGTKHFEYPTDEEVLQHFNGLITRN